MLTRRDLFIKWTVYGVVSCLLFLFDLLFLRGISPLGVTMFLPPLLVGMVASLEDTRSAVIYALVLGALCDVTLAGLFPCVYTLAFTLAALFDSMLAKSVLQPGVLCSIAVTALTFLFTDALNMLALFFREHAPFLPMLWLTLREIAASSLLLLICYPVLMFVHRKFTL